MYGDSRRSGERDQPKCIPGLNTKRTGPDPRLILSYILSAPYKVRRTADHGWRRRLLWIVRGLVVGTGFTRGRLYLLVLFTDRLGGLSKRWVGSASYRGAISRECKTQWAAFLIRANSMIVETPFNACLNAYLRSFRLRNSAVLVHRLGGPIRAGDSG